MNEGNTRHLVKAFLVADMDFSGPLPVVRQFSIFSNNPFHEPGLGPNRAWAVLMVREADSYARAKEEILHDLETAVHSFPERARVYDGISKLMDEAPDVKTHALKYRLPQALDTYIAAMPAPDHPFFKTRCAEPDMPSEERYFGEQGTSALERALYPDDGIVVS